MADEIRSYSKHILDLINECRKEKNLTPYENVKFVLESDVVCRTDRYTVSAKKIINDADIDGVINDMIRGGPSWLHVLVHWTETSAVVFALAAGAPVGAPEPDIMFGDATEKNPKLKIIQ